MNTLKDLNLNFSTLENSIKTIGIIIIIIIGFVLTISQIINPVEFTL